MGLFRIIFPSVYKFNNVTSPIIRSYKTCTNLLPNGIRIATEETGSPLATLGMFIEAGPRFETACNNGITHFIEHHAYKGFKSMNKVAFEDFAFQLGAKFYAVTGREIFALMVTTYPQYSKKIFEMFSRILFEPDVSDYNVEEEMKNIGLELMDCENDLKKVTFDYLHSTAFQGVPLGQRIIGPTRNICRFNRETVVKYIQEQFQPWRIVIGSSGGLNHTELCCQVQSMLGNLQSSDSAVSHYSPNRFSGSQVIYRDDSLPFAHVAIAVEVPGYASSEYYKMLVASHVVGSWDKSKGGGINNSLWLARAANCEHLCERFESFYIPYRDIGLWGIYFVATKMNLEDMLYNIQDLWMNLGVTLSQTEVERAIGTCKIEAAKKFCGSFNSCYDIGEQMMYRCKRDDVSEVLHNIRIVNADDVKYMAKRYIYDQCPAVAAVGPVENLPEYTRIRAGMYWLRL